MGDTKVLRVVGLASTVPFDKNDPLSSANRRISIVVLNQRTEMAILQEEGPQSEISNEGDISGGLNLPAAGKGTSG
jgi:chemotaxis protein MotB